MSFDTIAFGHQAAALYGIGAPIAQPDPSVPGQNNIVNANNQLEQPEAVEDRPTPMRYNAELARLLRNVAAETWATGDSKELEKLSATAIKAVKKADRQAVRESFKQFKGKSEAIQESLARLATYSARDMATALKRCSDWDMAQQMVEDAQTQEEKGLAEVALAQVAKPTDDEREKAREFESLVSALSDFAQDLRDFSMNRELPDSLRYGIDDLILTLDSRVSELGTLGMHLVEMAGQAEEHGGAYAEILDGNRNMVALAKGMGGVMHGNYENIARRADKVADACDALGRVLNKIESEIVSGQELSALQTAFIRADGQIGAVAGQLDGELAQTMDPKVLAGLRSKISKLRSRLVACRDIAVCKARLRFVKALPQPFATCLTDTSDETLRLCPRLKRLYHAQKAFTDALEAYVMDGAGPSKHPALNKAIRTFAGLFDDANVPSLIRELSGELNTLASQDKLTMDGHKLRTDVQVLLAENAKDDDKMTTAFIRGIFGINAFYVESFLYACRDQVQAIGEKPGTGVFLPGDVATVVAGKGKFSDLLLASLYDVGLQWIDQDLVDRPGVQSKTLGAGGVNTVEKITYPAPGGNAQPKTIVFKPDFLASVGNTKLSLFKDGYESTPQALKLNLASTVIARRLGCSNRLTKTSAMFHDGKLGIGMTYASGDEANSFVNKGKNTLDDLLESENPALRRKGLRIGNDIVRQTIDLQWLDLLAGQGDRHSKNYKIDIDANSNPPSTVVTGIDNDMCMAKYRTGLTRMQLSKERRKDIRDELIKTINTCKIRYANQSAKKVADKMMRDYFNKDGEIDFNQTPPLPPELVAALGKVTGVKSLCVPKAMSQAMFESLKAIAEDATGESRQAFIDEIAALLPPANAKAFAARLDNLLALVRDGKITVIPEPTDENPTPWLAQDVANNLSLQSFTYPLSDDKLPRDPEFKKVKDSANRIVGVFVVRDCGDLMQRLQSAATAKNQN